MSVGSTESLGSVVRTLLDSRLQSGWPPIGGSKSVFRTWECVYMYAGSHERCHERHGANGESQDRRRHWPEYRIANMMPCRRASAVRQCGWLGKPYYIPNTTLSHLTQPLRGLTGPMGLTGKQMCLPLELLFPYGNFTMRVNDLIIHTRKWDSTELPKLRRVLIEPVSTQYARISPTRSVRLKGCRRGVRRTYSSKVAEVGKRGVPRGPNSRSRAAGCCCCSARLRA